MNKLAACVAPQPASYRNKWNNIIEDVIIAIKENTGVAELRNQLIKYEDRGSMACYRSVNVIFILFSVSLWIIFSYFIW